MMSQQILLGAQDIIRSDESAILPSGAKGMGNRDEAYPTLHYIVHQTGMILIAACS